MPDKFSAMEKVTGRVRSQANRIQSFLSNLNWEEKREPASEFRDVKKIQELQDAYRRELSKLSQDDVIGTASLSANYLSRYITILRNYNALFQNTETNIRRYEQALIDLYEDRRGTLTMFPGEDDSQQGVIRKVVRGLQPSDYAPILSRVKQIRTDIEKATEDFHPDLLAMLNRAYNFDIENDLAELLILLSNVAEGLTQRFQQEIERADAKYQRYKEEARTGRRQPRANERQAQPEPEQQAQPEQAEETEEVEATDNYLTGAGNKRKLKVSVKK